MTRNNSMISRIEQTPVRYPFSFVVAGDSSFIPNVAGDRVFRRMLNRMGELLPAPLFFVNLGDFAGPGTQKRHTHYADMIRTLPFPGICVIGNHELDHPSGQANFENVVGPPNYDFAYGNTIFVAIRSCERCCPPHGPDKEDLDFLDKALQEDAGRHSVRVVLMHMPPNLNGHYAHHLRYRPHEPGWTFREFEPEFIRIVNSHGVAMICAAHITGYDRFTNQEMTVIVSGAGGGAMGIPPYDRIFEDVPPARAGFMHFVLITVQQSGRISGRVFRELGDRFESDPDYEFELAPVRCGSACPPRKRNMRAPNNTSGRRRR